VFVVHTLLNNPTLFDSYIAIDPSLKHMYNEGDSLLNQNLNGKKLYLASSDIAYGYLEDVAADMQADFAVFKKYLYQSRESNNLSFKIDHINDDHGNSYIQGISRGVRYILNWRFE
jgi:predicted alpha/beta superfamily hydrolase